MLETTAQATEQTPAPAAMRSADQALIKSLTPIGGSAVEVSPITVLVGSNNAGKTEILRDIPPLAANFDLNKAEVDADQEPQAVTLADLAFAPKLTVERVLFGLTVIDPDGREGAVVQGLGPNLKTPFRRAVGRELKNLLYRPIMSARSLWMTPLGALMPLRLSFVGLEDRRRLVRRQRRSVRWMARRTCYRYCNSPISKCKPNSTPRSARSLKACTSSWTIPSGCN